uniref:Uncharacterized protein n=1 Tax=Arundo donax TaxID=35708 RepID=A0A0A9AE85_ARUDO
MRCLRPSSSLDPSALPFLRLGCILPIRSHPLLIVPASAHLSCNQLLPSPPSPRLGPLGIGGEPASAHPILCQTLTHRYRLFSSLDASRQVYGAFEGGCILLSLPFPYRATQPGTYRASSMRSPTAVGSGATSARSLTGHHR